MRFALRALPLALFPPQKRWSRLARPGAWPFRGAPCRLNPPVYERTLHFFAWSGRRSWTPAAAFLTELAPAHVPGNMKEPASAIEDPHTGFVNHL